MKILLQNQYTYIQYINIEGIFLFFLFPSPSSPPALSPFWPLPLDSLSDNLLESRKGVLTYKRAVS